MLVEIAGTVPKMAERFRLLNYNNLQYPMKVSQRKKPVELFLFTVEATCLYPDS